jgi:hypothetical protein
LSARSAPSLDSDPESPCASALAQHLDCSRIYVCKLEAEGVIQRQGDGYLFPLHDHKPVVLKLRHDHLGQVSGLFRLYPIAVRSGIIFLGLFDKREMDCGVDHVSRIGHRHSSMLVC